jgi:hypothetical protein
MEIIATVQLGCGHRFCCRKCYNDLMERSGGRAKCPICRCPIEGETDTTLIQLNPATISESISRLQGSYPCGALIDNDNRIVGDARALQAVREACLAVRAGHLSSYELKNALATRLTVAQREMALVELHKDTDFHGVLQHLDSRLSETTKYQTLIQHMTVRAVHDTDNTAIALRAGGQAVVSVGAAVASSGLTALTTFTETDCIGGIIIFCVLTSLELYRCAKGELSLQEMGKNIGEHVVGTGASIAGAYGAALATNVVLNMEFALSGATVATSLGPAGTVLGLILGLGVGFGMDYFARKGYRHFFPSEQQEEEMRLEEMERQQTPEEIARGAAKQLNVDLATHSMAEAQSRFRRKLLSVHPDKNPNATPEEQDRLQEVTRTTIACWAIVREHYKSTIKGPDDGPGIEEAFVVGNILRCFDPMKNAWLIARTWFGELNLGREPDPETERIERIEIYL